MADDEQFSLCWNNFNSNLSAGFHESLLRGDLVDVTLAAEGQLVQAHRLVLSVCSPYFRTMFNQMPKNQHAFVFLKDVTHAALQDLIQFMYCGEVNVKQDALPAFISTAESLQIKGLTETGDSAPSQQSPAKEEISAVPATTASISTIVPTASQRTKGQRTRVQSSYKIESEESGDDKIHIQASTSHHVSAQQLQAQTNISSQKRTMPQRSITSHTIKRQKISISASSDGMDTSDTAPSQTQTVQTVQIVKQLPAQVIEPEYIELPMESINPKAEPDYTDEAAEIETVDAEAEQEHKLSEQGDADDDGNYVEDETYGDMTMGKYEESYLTEAEDGAKPGASGFVETYTSDGGTGTEQSTQVTRERRIIAAVVKPAKGDCSDSDETLAVFTKTMRGKEQLLYMGQPFVFEKLVLTHSGQSKKIWRCNQWWNQKCRARVYTIDRQITPLNGYHTHAEIVKRKQRVVRRDKTATSSETVTSNVKMTTAGKNTENKIAHKTSAAKQPTQPQTVQHTPKSTHQSAALKSSSTSVPQQTESRILSRKQIPLYDGMKKIIDKVPLHAGSSVYIATKDLLSIYTSKPAVYTGRLIELMYGVDTLKHSCVDRNEQADTDLTPLDPTILDAVITHIVHVFQQQNQHITNGMVRNFIRNRLQLLRTNVTAGSQSSKRESSKQAEKRLTKRKGTQLFSMIDNKHVMFSETPTGGKQLTYKNYIYHRNIKIADTVYWRCSKAIRMKCKATIVTQGDMMRVKEIKHNHVPMRRLTYGLGVNEKRKLKKHTIFIAISPERQLIRLRDKLYQKTIGRAYRSVWMCIEYGCPGEIVLRELKGGQIKITSAHNDDCTSDYFKNRPPNQIHLNANEITQLELNAKRPKKKPSRITQYELTYTSKGDPYLKQLKPDPQLKLEQQPNSQTSVKSPSKNTEKAHDHDASFAFRKLNIPVTVDGGKIQYTTGRGNNVLVCDGHRYIKNNCYGARLPYEDSLWHPLRISPQQSRAPQYSYKPSQRNGGHLLVVNGVTFFRNRQRNGKQYWKCNQYYKCKCPCIVLINEVSSQLCVKHCHNHDTSSLQSVAPAVSDAADAAATVRQSPHIEIFTTKSFRGRPAIIVDKQKYLLMSDKTNRIIWRCSSMATAKLKCPARIIQYKDTDQYSFPAKGIHQHAPLKRYRTTNCNTSYDMMLNHTVKYDSNSWIVVEKSLLQYTTTQRGRTMLIFSGYKFVENRQSKRNIFWRCARYVKHGCRAACVTSKNCTGSPTIRLTGLAHSHPPEDVKQTRVDDKPPMIADIVGH
ncbi:uncharacterized protein LOC128717110 [Anopheles marshallii]|uniref:uncharacterized protein LOC128717110 n=1 Tax=Anopheles marshallii TaxID=1521116 RepID=UPI00237AFB2F|nr:uncharacterized protein LOC128717110 [Anopheles marshallii]